MKEMTAALFNREVRSRGRLDRGELLDQTEAWLRAIAKRMGLKGEQVGRNGMADIASLRWDSDGKVRALVYLVDDKGRRYAAGSPAVTEWVEVPIPPPPGLKALAR